MKKSDPPIVVEETYDVSVSDLWNAITDPELMRKWFFDNIPDFKPEIGFKTTFSVSSGERDFRHRWKITEVIPREKITYNWKYDGYPGDSCVMFALSGDEHRARLRLSHEVREDFPDDIPEFTRESCLGGWEYFIRKNLKEFLEKN